MTQKLRQTTTEALHSVLPITIIVFMLSVVLSPMPVGTLMLFLFGSVMLIVGMGLFTLGADMSLMSMGEDIGAAMTKTRRIVIVISVSFFMGVIITVAEPDLLVLAKLVPGIPDKVLIFTVAAGVGLFLVLAVLRIIFRIKLSKMLIVCYAVLMVLSIFAPTNFVAVAFDSGGVTTGPVTVPFIMAMGLGLASVRGDKESAEDSFGLVALCSIGPILAVLILGICYRPTDALYAAPVIPEIVSSRDVTLEFMKNIPHYFVEVLNAVWPIVAVLALFQLLSRRYSMRRFIRILIGFIYTLAGLVLFMTGVNVGFIPVGQLLGADLGSSELKWLLIPLGALIGYFIVAAEPAVHVLKKQVEEVSGGAIPGKAVQTYLSVGVAVSLSIAMVRVLTGVSIYYFLIPGYIAAVLLTFFVPKIFTGIAFDSGGVVSGPMTSTFLLPFAIGACANPADIMTDAFGLVAMVAMTPLIAIQIMGVVYKKRMSLAAAALKEESGEEEIIEYMEEDDEDGENDE
ncbi:MAG: DUF1538 domain-containing protein [Oscillospiraceae bacterium]|jgi:hypothetical protein|nr:DUF1538 domain-containing protein [Oscillospiraceae bacterium]